MKKHCNGLCFRRSIGGVGLVMTLSAGRDGVVHRGEAVVHRRDLSQPKTGEGRDTERIRRE